MTLITRFLTIALFFSLGLTACQSQSTPSQTGPSTTSTDPPSSTPTPTTTETASQDSSSSGHDSSVSVGGQVVENGPYHLELVALPEAQKTHLDFYLQWGQDHSTIPDAKVEAKIQFPDGSIESLPLAYDAAGKHYAADLVSDARGDYQVAITADIQGESVQGRFNFNK